MIATYRVLREYMVDGPGGQFLEMPRRTAKMVYDPRPDCFRMFWQNLDGSWKELFQVHRDRVVITCMRDWPGHWRQSYFYRLWSEDWEPCNRRGVTVLRKRIDCGCEEKHYRYYRPANPNQPFVIHEDGSVGNLGPGSRRGCQRGYQNPKVAYQRAMQAIEILIRRMFEILPIPEDGRFHVEHGLGNGWLIEFSRDAWWKPGLIRIIVHRDKLSVRAFMRRGSSVRDLAIEADAPSAMSLLAHLERMLGERLTDSSFQNLSELISRIALLEAL